jgi:butyryl-CoA dehydrogenase
VGVAYAVNALGSFPIILGGTEEQKLRWLPAIASGEKLIAFGLSEMASGSDAGSLRTRAVPDGDCYVVDGDKKWNTNGNVASLYSPNLSPSRSSSWPAQPKEPDHDPHDHRRRARVHR